METQGVQENQKTMEVLIKSEVNKDSEIINETREVCRVLPNGETVCFLNDRQGEITRKQIEERYSQIRLTDKDEENGLELFCYIKCTNDDEDIVKKCRGVVFNKDKIVMKAFPFTREYSSTDEDNVKSVFSQTDFTKCRFYNSVEGTLIRVFNFNDKWFVSTHRKLNAFKSKWASKESFGDIFKRSLEEYMMNGGYEKVFDGVTESFDKESIKENTIEKVCSRLDKNNQYMFLVSNTPENRIVCTTKEVPELIHVGTFKNGELDLDDYVGFNKGKEHHFGSVEEMISEVESIDYDEFQGIIAFLPNNEQVKILTPKYQELFKIRGNESSIKFRYLQVRMNKRLSNGLYSLYPKYSKDFDDYENILYKIAQFIYRSYIARYISKRYITLPVEEFAVMRECHNWHCQDRGNNRINEEKVIEVLNQQPPTNLNHMIRRFRIDASKHREKHASRQYVTPKFGPKTPVVMDTHGASSARGDTHGASDGSSRQNTNISPMVLPINSQEARRTESMIDPISV